ncbi:hypothetical protein COV18_06165 [Candidatus Woesearchaeota archaeon CG10_big_fil_rev_8_21_14_0_10_37_12]|nr:MAG: hypothetical protein COV18_06165 [Candidatus Woesearchaeota archaeon CG10_big_fil_rev_8_21_14_0_10_37_12]
MSLETDLETLFNEACSELDVQTERAPTDHGFSIYGEREETVCSYQNGTAEGRKYEIASFEHGNKVTISKFDDAPYSIEVRVLSDRFDSEAERLSSLYVEPPVRPISPDIEGAEVTLRLCQKTVENLDGVYDKLKKVLDVN